MSHHTSTASPQLSIPSPALWLVVASLLILVFPHQVDARGNFANKVIKTKIVRVIDGDTFELASGDSVRLLHVNTPETGEVGADEATELCRALIENKEVEIHFGEVFEDHYGRLLAEVRAEGKNLNETLVRAGFAHAFFIPPVPAESQTRLVKAQIAARKANVGIWKDDPRYAGTFHITSFKHNAPGDDRENLNGEYVRIANIGSTPANLKGYKLLNQYEDGAVLPSIRIPVGRTVKIRVGSGKSQLLPRKGQQSIHLGRTRPLWSNDGDEAILMRPDGVIEDRVPSKKRRSSKKRRR